MTKVETAVSTKVSEEVLTVLKENYPQEQGFNRILLPRISFVGKDKTEGRGKTLKVIAEAGMFVLDELTDEQDEETGRFLWKKTDLGKTIEAIVFYTRRKLMFWDAAVEEMTSSAIYDTDTEKVPLFKSGLKINEGTEKELQAKFPMIQKGNFSFPALESTRVLYLLYKGKPYEMGISRMNKSSFLKYASKIPNAVPSVITKFSSTEETSGDNRYNSMSFTVSRNITEEEAGIVIAAMKDLKQMIVAEKGQYVQAEIVGEKKDTITF